MSAYPPGVSGNEWQIAGGDVMAVDETCGAPKVMAVPTFGVIDEIHALQSAAKLAAERPGEFVVPGIIDEAALIDWHREQWGALQTRLIDLLAGIYAAAAEVEWPEGCPGTTDEVEIVNGSGTWECPVCGTEHEVEAPGLDPDDEGRWDE